MNNLHQHLSSEKVESRTMLPSTSEVDDTLSSNTQSFNSSIENGIVHHDSKGNNSTGMTVAKGTSTKDSQAAKNLDVDVSMNTLENDFCSSTGHGHLASKNSFEIPKVDRKTEAQRDMKVKSLSRNHRKPSRFEDFVSLTSTGKVIQSEVQVNAKVNVPNYFGKKTTGKCKTDVDGDSSIVNVIADKVVRKRGRPRKKRPEDDIESGKPIASDVEAVDLTSFTDRNEVDASETKNERNIMHITSTLKTEKTAHRKHSKSSLNKSKKLISDTNKSACNDSGRTTFQVNPLKNHKGKDDGLLVASSSLRPDDKSHNNDVLIDFCKIVSNFSDYGESNAAQNSESVKKKRGRKRKFDVDFEDEPLIKYRRESSKVEDKTPKKRKVGRKKKSSGLTNGQDVVKQDGELHVGIIFCETCQKEFTCKSSLETHMATCHHQVWSAEEGRYIFKPYAVFKRFKVLRCLKCGKEHKNFSTHLFHTTKVCGIEPVNVSCEYCQVRLREGSLMTHQRVNCSVLRRERQERLLLEKKESERIEEGLEGGDESSAGNRTRRKASRRALRNIHDVSTAMNQNTPYDLGLVEQPRYFSPDGMIPEELLTKCKNCIADIGYVHCVYKGCSKKLRSGEGLVKHLSKCAHRPKRQLEDVFSCAKCKETFGTDQDAMEHTAREHEWSDPEIPAENDDDDSDREENSKSSLMTSSDESSDDDIDVSSLKDDLEGGRSVTGDSGATRMDWSRPKMKKEVWRFLKADSSTRLTRTHGQVKLEAMSCLFDEQAALDSQSESSLKFANNWRLKSKDVEMASDSEAKELLPALAESSEFVLRKKSSFKGKESTLSSCTRRLKLFESCGSDEDNLVLFAGGPVWSMAWCPVPLTANLSRLPQYLALYCHRDLTETNNQLVTSSKTCLVQIWDCGKLDRIDTAALPSLAFCLALPCGSVWDMKWCPNGSWDSYSSPERKSDGLLSRMGLLALASHNGLVHILSVPQSDSLPCQPPSFGESDRSNVSVYHLSDVVTLQPTCSASYVIRPCLCIDWSTADRCSLIAAGFADGTVGLFDLDSSSPHLQIRPPDAVLLPFRCFFAHVGPVRSLSFCPFDSNLLATGGQDRHLKIWSLSDTHFPISYMTEFKSNVNRVTWPRYNGFVHVAQDDTYSTRGRCQNFAFSAYAFGKQACYNTTLHDCACLCISFNDWLQTVASCDVAGDVLIDEVPKVKEKLVGVGRRILLTTEIEGILPARTSQDEGILTQLKEAKQPPSTEVVLNEKAVMENHWTADFVKSEIEPAEISNTEKRLEGEGRGRVGGGESCQEYLMRHRLIFNDHPSKQSNKKNPNERERDGSKDVVGEPPVRAWNSLQWNPNYGSHTWLAMGGSAGLVILKRVPDIEPKSVQNLVKHLEKTFLTKNRSGIT